MSCLGRLLAGASLAVACMAGASDAGVDLQSARATPPRPVEATSIPWYDALDTSAGARIASNGSFGVDLSLRWRLDAREFLALAAADARDLAEHSTALALHAWNLDHLERIARSCEVAWRSAQVALIDRFLLAPSRPDDVTAELTLMRALLAPTSVWPFDIATIAACRLDVVAVSLDIATDHPRVVAAMAEQRLGERSARMFDVPAPMVVWLHADLWRDTTHARGGLRVGIDVPLPSRVGTTEVTLATDGQIADAGVRWVHTAGSTPRHANVPRSVAATNPLGDLDAALGRLRSEVQLRRLDAFRRWSHACGDDDARTLDACLRRTPIDAIGLEAVFAAVDAELLVLHTALAAIEASGQPLARLVDGP